jgi:hypothetical protein
MRIALIVFGIIAAVFSVLAFATLLSKGTDLQLIAAGVFGTMSAVCFGFSATLARLESPQKDTAIDLARELLGRWNSVDESTRSRLARDLIGKIDPSGSDLSGLHGSDLRNLLSSLATKA